MELELFWFPYAKDAYIPSWCKEKKAELEASGEYFGVRIRSKYYVDVLMARNPDAWDENGNLVESTMLDRREAIEKGYVEDNDV